MYLWFQEDIFIYHKLSWGQGLTLNTNFIFFICIFYIQPEGKFILYIYFFCILTVLHHMRSDTKCSSCGIRLVLQKFGEFLFLSLCSTSIKMGQEYLYLLFFTTRLFHYLWQVGAIGSKTILVAIAVVQPLTIASLDCTLH